MDNLDPEELKIFAVFEAVADAMNSIQANMEATDTDMVYALAHAALGMHHEQRWVEFVAAAFTDTELCHEEFLSARGLVPMISSTAH